MSTFHFSPRPNRAHEIHWHEWGDGAFQKAKTEDKLILLDIGAVWCHWCHVMDETTYSDPQVIRMLNERFIPIRVDTDQRPDINRRYNMGGWPSTAFVTPDGEALTGGTYVPVAQMKQMLAQMSEAYKQAKDEITNKTREINAQRANLLAQQAQTRGTLSDEIRQNVLNALREQFDALYGGFGNEPKFPAWDALELALAQYDQSGDEDYRAVVTITLKRVLLSGTYDQVAGGFFRYATTRDWSVPHFEKMLEDNARWLTLLIHAYQLTAREEYRAAIRTVVNYVNPTLRDESAEYFFASQDADEEYYALDQEQRAQKQAPYVDRTLYADWNMQMVSAYLQAARVLNDISLQKFAINVLSSTLEKMYAQDDGMRHFLKVGSEKPEGAGLLADQIYTARALLDAYEATGRNTYLFRAMGLMEFVLDKFEDKAAGGFYSEIPNPAQSGLLRLPDKQMGENAVAAQLLLRLAHLLDAEKYRATAQRALEFFAGEYAGHSFLASDYALAVENFLHEPLTVCVVGMHGDAHAQALIDAARDLYAPGKIIRWLDPARDAERLNALNYPAPTPSASAQDSAIAYVCVGQTCLPGTSDPLQLRVSVERMKASRQSVVASAQ